MTLMCASIAIILLAWTSGAAAAQQAADPTTSDSAVKLRGVERVPTGLDVGQPVSASILSHPQEDALTSANAGGTARASNVGIGTAAPNFPLSFPDTLGDKISLFGQSGAHYGFGIQSGLLQIHGNDTNSAIAFGSGSSAFFFEVMRIRANGAVGIGSEGSDAWKLYVESGFSTSGGAIYGSTFNSSASGVAGFNYNNGVGVSGQTHTGTGMHGRADQAGGWGVFGESLSSYGVYGVSISGYGVVGRSDTNYAGYFFGNVYVNGTVTQTSDMRLKQGIRTLGYGLHEVLQLRPVSWTWKEKSDGRAQLGLIAQEVETVVPELVTTATDEEQTKGLNYLGLLPVVIKAIQEQQDTITALNARLKALELELQQLRGQR